MKNGNDESENNFGNFVKNNITPLITLSTFIALVFGFYFWIEARYAIAEELAQLEQRFEIKVRSDILRETNARIWQLEDRLRANPNDVTAQEDLRELKEDKNRIERELKALGPP